MRARIPVTDARGREFQASETPKRIVSLVPSVTETLFELGVGDGVVGATDFCIFPENLDCKRVGGTKNPRVDEIRALQPDLVHMNLEENLRRHAEAIEAFAPVYASEPKTVAGVVELIDTLGVIHGCVPAADTFVHALNTELAVLPVKQFTFACPIWRDPWMWCGGDTYVSDLVSRAGGTNVLADRTRYPQVTLEEVLALRPDVIFLPDEPYAFTQADASLIRGARVIGPFPGHLFTWHGTRTIHGLRFLRESV